MDGASLVIVIGGSSGLGLAVARAARNTGARVVIGGRSPERLHAATDDLGDNAIGRQVDVTDDTSVDAFFKAAGSCDHLVVTAGSGASGPFRELPIAQAIDAMNGKFWGAYRAARRVDIRQGGSITFVSGILSRRPRPGSAALSGINAGLEGLGRALAAELAPVRVNVIAPGLVADTGAYTSMSAEDRQAMYDNAASKLPVARVGRPEDIAAAVLAAMTNPYVTGSVIDVDGGGLLA